MEGWAGGTQRWQAGKDLTGLPALNWMEPHEQIPPCSAHLRLGWPGVPQGKHFPSPAGLDSDTRWSSLAHSSLPPSSPAVPQQSSFISTNRS